MKGHRASSLVCIWALIAATPVSALGTTDPFQGRIDFALSLIRAMYPELRHDGASIVIGGDLETPWRKWLPLQVSIYKHVPPDQTGSQRGLPQPVLEGLFRGLFRAGSSLSRCYFPVHMLTAARRTSFRPPSPATVHRRSSAPW